MVSLPSTSNLMNTYPDLPIPDLSEWSNMDLTTADATLYLMRFDPVNASAAGAFNLTLKNGSVRGLLVSVRLIGKRRVLSLGYSQHRRG